MRSYWLVFVEQIEGLASFEHHRTGFETIHPFLDGNGRMGRLLITFLLCQRQLYLSYYFHAHKSEYYAHLQNIRDEGDWESWLKFFLTGVHEVAREATTTTRAIIQLRESHRALIARAFRRASGAGAVLLEFLYKRPIVTVKSVMGDHSIELCQC